LTGGAGSDLGDILSVAPRYVAGADGAQAGHYTIYQDDLRGAAARLGFRMVTLAMRALLEAEGVETCLDTTGERTIATSAAQRARSGDLVVCYEGSLAMMDAFARVAAERRDVTFLVNLFRPEAGLTPDRARRATGRARRDAQHPANLFVSAETDLRVDLARGLGVPCVGAWRLHSTLWDVHVAPEPYSDRSGPLKVLVPLAGRGYGADVVHDLAYVMLSLRGHGVEWTVTGASSDRFNATVRGPRLVELGARRLDAPAEREGYAALFASHDVVWIPNRASYRSQSSGKALDALVMGRPVVAPRGSWPATEASRWLGEDPSYEDLEEAAERFFALARDPARWHAPLEATGDRIRRAYAPEATVLRMLELTGRRSAQGNLPDSGRFALEPLPGVAESRSQTLALGLPQPPVRERLVTRWRAARAARIGLTLRARRRLIRAAWRLRERLRTSP
jgi:hypothetical protein